MPRVPRLNPSRPVRRPTRWLAWTVAGVAVLGAVAIPSAAQASPATPSHSGATGLHDTMLPPDSPDAKGDPGLAGGARAGAQTAGPMAAVPLAVGTGQLSGIDVSHFQDERGAIDWTQVKASGQSFAIMKAAEGVGWTDPYFHQNITGAAAAGLVVGAYTYGHPETDPVQQADYFADTIGVLPQGSLPPVLDLEANGGLAPAALVAWTQRFLDELEFRTGIVPMIYSSPTWYATNLGNSTAFTRYPLWEAHYTSAAAPNPMGGWPTYDVWQYTSTASVAGITGDVDQNRFNGTLTDLRALATSSGMPAIVARATDGDTAATIGAATTGIICGLAGGGCGQQFANNASIYWSPSTGAHLVSGAIRTLWTSTGWETNFGYPTQDLVCGLRDGGCGQGFSTGVTVYTSAASGTHEVRGGIRSYFIGQGWENGPLGYPTSGEFCGLVGGGCGEHFQGGSVYWSPATGVHSVTGAVRALWSSTGWENNFGYPTQDLVCGLRNGGCGQGFSTGVTVYTTAASGTHEVRGGIRSFFIGQGWENGPLGYPTSGEFCGLLRGGCGEHFQGGSVYWSPATGVHSVTGAIRDVWAADRWENGQYGYPTGEAYRSGAYWVQRFQYGTITVLA